MASKNTAGRRKLVLAFLLLFGPAFLLIVIGLQKCEHKFLELEDYGEAVDYSFTDAFGKEFTSADFKDNVVLITTLQSTCPDSCAISFWHFDQMLYKIAAKTDEKGGVHIISFVTDGEGNPVEDLSTVHDMLKDRVQHYNPKIWHLASGDAKSLFDFDYDGKALLQTGDEDFEDLMLLMDHDNHLRMVLHGNTEGMIRRMKQHVALLQKQYDKKAYDENHE
ncbi:MAG: SCO family protein [Crocinitomicaceae bacterium]|nr:SCO family protein [Crocinitomicaceae bacterium]